MDTKGPGGFLVSDKGKVASSSALHTTEAVGDKFCYYHYFFKGKMFIRFTFLQIPSCFSICLLQSHKYDPGGVLAKPQGPCTV